MGVMRAVKLVTSIIMTARSHDRNWLQAWLDFQWPFFRHLKTLPHSPEMRLAFNIQPVLFMFAI